MRKRELLKHIERARKKVVKRISDYRSQGGLYARGLGGEGYKGGYRDALDDVILLLNDVMPRRQDYWD